jgi:hypothetical protein
MVMPPTSVSSSRMLFRYFAEILSPSISRAILESSERLIVSHSPDTWVIAIIVNAGRFQQQRRPRAEAS